MNELNKQYNIEWNLKPYQEEYDDRISPFYAGPKIFQQAQLVELMGGPINFFKEIFRSNETTTKSITNVLDNISPIECRRLLVCRIELPSTFHYTHANSVSLISFFVSTHQNSNKHLSFFMEFFYTINRQVGCYDGE